ncbi:MFS transporter [Actinoplanes sp. CA-030573]|uniref:MFS transporter n=1 Tax=Actinoplanes sp. CA-030573 TaxID=3239898 RepID=UPI003D8F9A9D
MAAAIPLAVFVLVQSRVPAPLLPLRIVTDRNRAGIYLGVALLMIAIFGQFLFLAYYFQQIKGWSPLTSGLAFLPLTVALAIGSTQIGARLVTRLPARALLVPGYLSAAAAMLLLAQLSTSSSYTTLIVPAQLLLGLGMGTAFTAAMNVATAGVQPQDAGIASALLNTSQQVGGAIGTALMNTVAAGATATWLTRSTAQQAAVHGYATAFALASACALAAAIIVLICVNVRPQRPHDSAPAGGRSTPVATH